eukprot:gene11108-biopygen6342
MRGGVYVHRKGGLNFPNGDPGPGTRISKSGRVAEACPPVGPSKEQGKEAAVHAATKNLAESQERRFWRSVQGRQQGENSMWPDSWRAKDGLWRRGRRFRRRGRRRRSPLRAGASWCPGEPTLEWRPFAERCCSGQLFGGSSRGGLAPVNPVGGGTG